MTSRMSARAIGALILVAVTTSCGDSPTTPPPCYYLSLEPMELIVAPGTTVTAADPGGKTKTITIALTVEDPRAVAAR